MRGYEDVERRIFLMMSLIRDYELRHGCCLHSHACIESMHRD